MIRKLECRVVATGDRLRVCGLFESRRYVVQCRPSCALSLRTAKLESRKRKRRAARESRETFEMTFESRSCVTALAALGVTSGPVGSRERQAECHCATTGEFEGRRSRAFEWDLETSAAFELLGPKSLPQDRLRSSGSRESRVTRAQWHTSCSLSQGREAGGSKPQDPRRERESIRRSFRTFGSRGCLP